MAGYDEGREWQEITASDAAQYAADVAADEAAEAAYYAALMAEAEAAQAAHIAAEDARVAALVQVGPYTYADPTCRQCRGTGVVSDTVDYGSTTAQNDSPCECQIDYLWAVTDGDGIATTFGCLYARRCAGARRSIVAWCMARYYAVSHRRRAARRMRHHCPASGVGRGVR